MAAGPNVTRAALVKSKEAFRTISEVADDMGLAQHVLRFWESKFTQIRPLKRGGNRRYYRPGDIQLLEAIRRLLHEEGYTIKGVQRLFKEQGVKATIDKILEGNTGEACEQTAPCMLVPEQERQTGQVIPLKPRVKEDSKPPTIRITEEKTASTPVVKEGNGQSVRGSSVGRSRLQLLLKELKSLRAEFTD